MIWLQTVVVMVRFFVDFQVFRGARNEYTFKELAEIDVRRGRYDLILYTPP